MSSRDARILVVDDDPDLVDFLVESLETAGFDAVGTTSPRDALERPDATTFDMVVADVEMPEMRGIDLVGAIHARRPTQLVLLMTAFGSIDLAVAALRAGACDFVTKPFTIEVLLRAMERALQERRMRREIVRLRQSLSERVEEGEAAAASPAMRRVLELGARAARTDSTVLVTGESGVGKGTVARYIHDRSPRRGKPFVQVNCAALPLPLVESELFGVRRGAFTDAREDRPGLLLQAHGGTLLLDEVGELPMEAQAKLLQVLETGRVRPVGSDKDHAADVRIVAATNQSLEDALRERRFRPDLYYRLNVIRLEIPPLRERRDDIPVLVDALIARIGARLGRELVAVSAGAMRALLAHDWPGNVRELANVLERALALSEHDTLTAEDLDLPTAAPEQRGYLEQAAQDGRSLEEVERAYIERVLDVVGGNKAEASRILGIDRRTIYRKLGEE